VWQATDTKLARDVAVRILPEAVAQHPDRMRDSPAEVVLGQHKA
jgi:hypothetical protein